MEMSDNVTNEEYLEYAEYIHGRRPVQSMDEQQAHDTVGAVAIDCNGYLAYANSTGICTHYYTIIRCVNNRVHSIRIANKLQIEYYK